MQFHTFGYSGIDNRAYKRSLHRLFGQIRASKRDACPSNNAVGQALPTWKAVSCCSLDSDFGTFKRLFRLTWCLGRFRLRRLSRADLERPIIYATSILEPNKRQKWSVRVQFGGQWASRGNRRQSHRLIRNRARCWGVLRDVAAPSDAILRTREWRRDRSKYTYRTAARLGRLWAVH